MEKKEIPVTETELYMLAADMVMENLPFTNPAFAPKDSDECVSLLEKLIGEKKLSIDWLRSVASANVSNAHCYIDYGMDEKWIYLGGMSRATNTREDFIQYIAKVRLQMEKGQVVFKNAEGKIINPKKRKEKRKAQKKARKRNRK